MAHTGKEFVYLPSSASLRIVLREWALSSKYGRTFSTSPAGNLVHIVNKCSTLSLLFSKTSIFAMSSLSKYDANSWLLKRARGSRFLSKWSLFFSMKIFVSPASSCLSIKIMKSKTLILKIVM